MNYPGMKVRNLSNHIYKVYIKYLYLAIAFLFSLLTISYNFINKYPSHLRASKIELQIIVL